MPSDNDFDDGEELIVCTCMNDCPSACKGQCGCRACHTAWLDFQSDDYA